MGLGITKEGVYTKWEIPLMQGDLPHSNINDWSDNSWLVEHLRQLADKIENENPRIINIGLRINNQYKSPELYVELFDRE